MSKKEIILEAATRLFAQKGFKESSIAELAKMTGAAEGTVFYHFKSKEDLFVTILDGLKEDIVEEFDQYSRQEAFENGLDMLEGAISFFFYLAGKMEDRFLLLHRHDPYQMAEVNPSCRNHLEAIYDCFLGIFEKAVQHGLKDGSMAEVPAKKTALIIFAMVDGLVRFNTYRLYDAGTLYNEVIGSCRRMVRNKHWDGSCSC